MKWWIAGVSAALISSAAGAGSYRVVLEPKDGNMLTGHAGVQAVDDRTATALVRIVSPGNEVAERGTVRVLVMNLGSRPFDFGPENVRLTLSDGTVLQASSVDQFEKGRVLVERETRIAGASDFRNRNNLSGLEQQGNATPSAPIPGVSPVGSNSSSNTTSQDRKTDDSLQPGAQTLNGNYQILVTQPVAPSKAWGGYYVFDKPKAVALRRADQPLAIAVTTGPETHQFNATLKWKK